MAVSASLIFTIIRQMPWGRNGINAGAERFALLYVPPWGIRRSLHWRAEAAKEEQLKQQWEASYVALNESVDKFNEQQKALTEAVNQLKISQTKQTQDLKNALKQHQTWADSLIPDSVRGVLNSTADH